MRLLEMSISAGVLILLLAVLRRGNFRNLTKRTVMMLWMVVLARLLLPGSLPIRKGIAAPVFGLLRRVCSLHTAPIEDTGRRTAVVLVPEAASFGTADPAGARLLQHAAGWLWLAGMAGIGIYFAYSYWKEYRLLAQALPLESVPNSETGNRQITEACKTAYRLAGMCPWKNTIRIYVHDRIRSPLVFGIIRQKIVIPKSLLQLEQTQMQYVLTHEMVHIRRHDNLWKLLSAAAVCIHWFNPAVWLMYILSARDLELSCDERVLSVHGSRGRQEYAMTLLTLAQNQMGTTLFCSGFLENPVKERIVAIMKYKKLTGIGVLCTVMLFAGASSVFATNEQTAHLQETEEAKQADVSYVKDRADRTDTADAKAQGKEAEPEEGLAKVIVQDEDEDSILLEINPDVEFVDGDGITVKFSEPVSAEGMYAEKIYSWYEDEDGVIHVRNEKGEELEKGKVYKLSKQDVTLEVDDSAMDENSSGDTAAVDISKATDSELDSSDSNVSASEYEVFDAEAVK